MHAKAKSSRTLLMMMLAISFIYLFITWPVAQSTLGLRIPTYTAHSSFHSNQDNSHI